MVEEKSGLMNTRPVHLAGSRKQAMRWHAPVCRTGLPSSRECRHRGTHYVFTIPVTAGVESTNRGRLNRA